MTEIQVHFSSDTNEWPTPQALFDVLNAEFGFTVDVCATQENKKVDRYYTKAENGLAQCWKVETAWMNPPFGHEIKLWMEKAFHSARHGGTGSLPGPGSDRYPLVASLGNEGRRDSIFRQAIAVCRRRAESAISGSGDRIPADSWEVEDDGHVCARWGVDKTKPPVIAVAAATGVHKQLRQLCIQILMGASRNERQSDECRVRPFP